ncbi:MAG: T9SS type A sorting domain-containing protein [Dehalococcoidia bacterium]|nr:T9SS type A sorting domain-containing protein [Dehalococcoidia bacterium]
MREPVGLDAQINRRNIMVLEVSPSIAKNEDRSDSMNARKRLPAALAGLVSGKARNTGPAVRGKTSPPRPCWRFMQATQGWFSATGRMFLFAGLAALAVSLFPESAYGQRLLVGNTNQAYLTGNDGVMPSTHDRAQAFTTGSNSTGYKLTSVELIMNAVFISTAPYNMRIYTNSSGAPGTSIGSLTKPATLTDGLNEFTATGAGIDLDPSTTYFLVFDTNSSNNNGWLSTDAGTEDSGSANGWTIADKHLHRNWNSTGAWSETANVIFQIRINGYIKLRNPPTVRIDNASAPENADFIQFTIRFSHEVGYGIRLDFETLTTGTANSGTDYEAADLTLNIRPNTRSYEVGVGLIQDTANDAGETMNVQISNAQLIRDDGHPLQSLTITDDEARGTITAPTTTTTNLSNVNLRIENTRGSEKGGWLRFTVKLSKPQNEYVCYDFETLTTGTAEPGLDYLAQPKVDFWMDKGEVRQRPVVRILKDSENENNETVIVQISNARLCDDPSKTINIARSQATGTIRNSRSSGKRVALPDSPQLAQNAPNPFNSQTILAYFLPQPDWVRLEVFALSGQRVAVLHHGLQQAGYHQFRWHGHDDAGHPVASGAYLYRLVTAEEILTRKLMLLR